MSRKNDSPEPQAQPPEPEKAPDAPTPTAVPDAATPTPTAEELAVKVAMLTGQLAAAQKTIRRENQHTSQIKASLARVRRLEEFADDKAKENSAAKKAAETAVEEHLMLLEELTSGQQHLPFGEPEPVASPIADDADSQPFMAPVGTPIAVLHEAHGLGKRTLNKLRKNGFDSVESIRDWTNPIDKGGRGKRLQDIVAWHDTDDASFLNAMDSYWKAQDLAIDSAPDSDVVTTLDILDIPELRGIAASEFDQDDDPMPE